MTYLSPMGPPAAALLMEHETKKPSQRKAAPARDKSPSPADDPPIAPPEGGRRSDLDGKFEADHRPSR